MEFACSGHEGLLQSVAVLPDPPAARLLSKCPVATRGPWSGLIIDDLFSISTEEVGAATEGLPAHSEVLLRRAKAAYDAEGVLGSDHKDQFSAQVCTVAGAQIDASVMCSSGCRRREGLRCPMPPSRLQPAAGFRSNWPRLWPARGLLP